MIKYIALCSDSYRPNRLIRDSNKLKCFAFQQKLLQSEKTFMIWMERKPTKLSRYTIIRKLSFCQKKINSLLNMRTYFVLSGTDATSLLNRPHSYLDFLIQFKQTERMIHSVVLLVRLSTDLLNKLLTDADLKGLYSILITHANRNRKKLTNELPAESKNLNFEH